MKGGFRHSCIQAWKQCCQNSLLLPMIELSPLLASFSGRPGLGGAFMALPAQKKMVPFVQGLSETFRANYCDQEDGLHNKGGMRGVSMTQSTRKGVGETPGRNWACFLKETGSLEVWRQHDGKEKTPGIQHGVKTRPPSSFCAV